MVFRKKDGYERKLSPTSPYATPSISPPAPLHSTLHRGREVDARDAGTHGPQVLLRCWVVCVRCARLHGAIAHVLPLHGGHLFTQRAVKRCACSLLRRLHTVRVHVPLRTYVFSSNSSTHTHNSRARGKFQGRQLRIIFPIKWVGGGLQLILE